MRMYSTILLPTQLFTIFLGDGIVERACCVCVVWLRSIFFLDGNPDCCPLYSHIRVEFKSTQSSNDNAKRDEYAIIRTVMLGFGKWKCPQLQKYDRFGRLTESNGSVESNSTEMWSDSVRVSVPCVFVTQKMHYIRESVKAERYVECAPAIGKNGVGELGWPNACWHVQDEQ